ncbi:hypothetical protein [Deinococcus yavapaiensis]|uniref:Uncharacterized protein n=1 Tax=Deinococcus yavapaiensis KR-236 TaxID=694435 RepID=A0A318SHM5_9DEIO|nr:hypothetical protein [Deinococcus yavapaiensis]PYE56645.1 hypothetical protein DES52_101450 [Deinococcus yavapaiensis KR-236]
MLHGHTLERLRGTLPKVARRYTAADSRGWQAVASVLREGGWAYLARPEDGTLERAIVLMVFENEAELFEDLPDGLLLAAVKDDGGELVLIEPAAPLEWSYAPN